MPSGYFRCKPTPCWTANSSPKHRLLCVCIISFPVDSRAVNLRRLPTHGIKGNYVFKISKTRLVSLIFYSSGWTSRYPWGQTLVKHHPDNENHKSLLKTFLPFKCLSTKWEEDLAETFGINFGSYNRFKWCLWPTGDSSVHFTTETSSFLCTTFLCVFLIITGCFWTIQQERVVSYFNMRLTPKQPLYLKREGILWILRGCQSGILRLPNI